MVPDIARIYEERMAKSREEGTSEPQRGRIASRRRAHFADDENRPHYRRSRSRTTPYVERYDPNARTPPPKQDERKRENIRPQWTEKGQPSRRHEPKSAQHKIAPPPGVDVNVQAPPPRPHSRPPLQNPAAHRQGSTVPYDEQDHSTSTFDTTTNTEQDTTA